MMSLIEYYVIYIPMVISADPRLSQTRKYDPIISAVFRAEYPKSIGCLYEISTLTTSPPENGFLLYVNQTILFHNKRT